MQTHIAVHRKPKFLIVDMIKKLFAMAAALFVTATANARAKAEYEKYMAKTKAEADFWSGK